MVILSPGNWNMPQTYSVTRVEKGQRHDDSIVLLGHDLPTPPVNMGPRSTPTYLLRLNMAIPPTAGAGAGNPMGVLAADLSGFPNGRRL
jgi:hypothetical protein